MVIIDNIQVTQKSVLICLTIKAIPLAHTIVKFSF